MTKDNARAEIVEQRHKDCWRCFHCGETFTDDSSARKHFGPDEGSVAACVIKAGAEQGLLGALRKVEAELADAWHAIHSESTDAAKAYYAQQSRHQEQMRLAEEAGYEKGLADGRALTLPANAGPLQWAVADKLANWINALDTSEMTVRDLRSAVYSWALEFRPPANAGAAEHPLARMVAMDEELEAKHPGWMCGDEATANAGADCEGCPPVGYPTDETRCLPCPRRANAGAGDSGEATGWLIEHEDEPKWLTLLGGAIDTVVVAWTKDSRKAMRFARRVDAENYVDAHFGGEGPIRITEHAWNVAALSPAAGREGEI